MVKLGSGVAELLSTTVTEDAVGGVHVGKVVAGIVNDVSDQSLRGDLEPKPVTPKVDYTEPMSPLTRSRLAEKALAEEQAIEEFKDLPGYDPTAMRKTVK